MPRRRPADPPPRRQRITNDIGVVDAETLISSKRHDLSEKTKTLLRLLCQRACTTQEIIDHLIKSGHIDDALDYYNQKLIAYHGMKRHRVIKNKDGFWFVEGSPADYSMRPSHQRPRITDINRHWLRSFLFEVLKNGAELTSSQLCDHLSRSGLMDTAAWSRSKLHNRIKSTFDSNPELFIRKNNPTDNARRHHTRWCLRPKAKLPLTFYNQQVLALWQTMMSANQITGWTLVELQRAVSRPGSDFKTGSDAQKTTVKSNLCKQYLKDDRFIKLSHGLYRARPPKILKKPAERSDWLKLVISIAKDLGKKDRTIPDFETVRKGIVQYGHLYGYDTQAMGDFLNNQVAITYTQLFGSENVVNITPSFSHIYIEDDEDEDEQESEEEKPEIFWPEDR